MRRACVSAVLAVLAAACDRGPVTIDSTAALPAPGTRMPQFSIPSPNVGVVDNSRLHIGHTIISLLPARMTAAGAYYAADREPVLRQLDSLEHENPMFRHMAIFDTVALISDSMGNKPTWLMGTEIGFANRPLAEIFGSGTRDSSDRHRRAVFTLPSFIVVSDSGIVLARTAGRPYAALKPVLDSLRRVWQSTRDGEAAVLIARGKPVIERGLMTFDPDSLVAPEVGLRLDIGCGGEEGAERGIVPAVGRVISIEGRHPGISTVVEFISVADVRPIDDTNLCMADRAKLTPRVATARYRVAFFEELATRDSAYWTIDTSFEPDSSDRSGRDVLVGLRPRGKLKLELPSGVTMETLRARIDSVRKTVHWGSSGAR